ncbi:NACHT domain-containing protein [Actinoplanes sp. NPDC049118]|uniref:NACHT domain-containing protein n=1 Tax=Actinoplanes sp. NPDC049118 TaxID=3155769 RepID=UPI0033F18B34
MAGGRRGGASRRLAWGLLLLAASVVLFGLAWLLQDSGMLGGLDQLFSVIGGSAGAAALYLTVRPHRPAAAPAAGGDPATLDALASTVAAVWRPEQRHRRLLNPHPLPTAWTTIGPPIADHWSNIRSDGDPTPLDLDGCLDLHHPDALHRVLTDERLRGRVVVLGEPGAGKTALLLREALRLLQAREPGGRVPVLLRLSTWNPDEQNLEQWIASQLVGEYACHAPVSTDRLLPLLDGLDEIPAPRRARALQAISNTFDSDHPLVLTSRSNEYLDSLAALPGIAMAAAVVLELTDVPADVAREYLQRATGRADWAQVFDRDAAAHGGRLAAALTEPLWIDLARTTYADPDQPDNQPAELLGLPDTDTVHTYLLDRLIVTAYPDPPEPSPAGQVWRRADAARYLRHLADHMQRQNTQDFAWWELARTVPLRARLAQTVAAALAFGLAAGLAFGLTIGPLFGLVVGLAFGLAFGFQFWRSTWRLAPSRSQVRWRRSDQSVVYRLGFVFVWGLVCGLAGMVAVVLGGVLAVGLTGVLEVGLTFGLTVGLAVGLTSGLAFGLGNEFTTVLDRSDADLLSTDPLGLLRNDRRRTLVTALAVGIAFVLAVGVTVVLAVGLMFELVGLLVSGPAVGLAFALATNSWGVFQCARLWWCGRHALPWPLMTFLADAHRRGLLRQAGGVYQLRHALLRDRLTSQAHSGPAIPATRTADASSHAYGGEPLDIDSSNTA